MNEDKYFECPYCGSSNGLFIDFSGENRQQFTTDCETCCRPIVIRAKLSQGNIVDLRVERENG